MFIKSIVLVVCLYGSVQSSILHNKTQEQLDTLIQETFPAGYDSKLKYTFAKLATPHSSRSKRHNRPVEFTINNETIQLNLQPVKNNVFDRGTPVWTVETDYLAENFHTYKRVDEKDYYLDGTFFEDVRKKALLYGFYKNKHIYYDGVIGQSRRMKVIKSIPEKYLNTELVGSNDHIICIVGNKEAYTTGNIGNKFHLQYVRKLEKPLDQLYPKLVLVVEHNYFKLFRENIFDSVKYLKILWNAVNMNYHEIPHPKVDIKITGIVIAKDEDALEYIQLARSKSDANEIDSTTLIFEGCQYFYGNFEEAVNFNNFDSAVVMTNSKSANSIGAAYSASICMKCVIYCRDDAKFDSILTATHELGHALSLTHDDEDLTHVPWNSTYLSNTDVLVDSYHWSQRSLDQLQAFASTILADCLNTSHVY